jgi:hypothetical protein
METLEQALEEDRRTTRFLKIKLYIDLYVQIGILGVFFYVWGFGSGDKAAGVFYFILGGYQLASSLVHLLTPNAFKNRKGYYVQLLIHGFIWANIFLSIVAESVFAPGMMGLYVELFFSPLTAIYYFVITIMDLQALPKHT